MLVIASPALAHLDATFEPHLAKLLLNALRDAADPLVVFDLGSVDYFGSMFLAVLLRCWKHTTSRGGALVLCGVSSQLKDLLRVTALDMIWPIYPDRRSAMDALLAD